VPQVDSQIVGRKVGFLRTNTHRGLSKKTAQVDEILLAVLWIRIRMFLGIPDPHPLVTNTDPAPDLSIIKQNSKKTLISTVLRLIYGFLLVYRIRIRLFLYLLDPHTGPLDRGTVPRIWIRIRIRTKMSRIHNCAY
jgi:hypothetical protein